MWLEISIIHFRLNQLYRQHFLAHLLHTPSVPQVSVSNSCSYNKSTIIILRANKPNKYNSSHLVSICTSLLTSLSELTSPTSIWFQFLIFTRLLSSLSELTSQTSIVPTWFQFVAKKWSYISCQLKSPAARFPDDITATTLYAYTQTSNIAHKINLLVIGPDRYRIQDVRS